MFRARLAKLNLCSRNHFLSFQRATMHGSSNRDKRPGYRVLRLPFDGGGNPTGEYEDFMTGFVVSNTQVWGRPVGVAVANDGSLFVTEGGNGTIWRVTYQGGPKRQQNTNDERNHWPKLGRPDG
jgi:sugar lactone lactonase YvrE